MSGQGRSVSENSEIIEASRLRVTSGAIDDSEPLWNDQCDALAQRRSKSAALGEWPFAGLLRDESIDPLTLAGAYQHGQA